MPRVHGCFVRVREERGTVYLARLQMRMFLPRERVNLSIGNTTIPRNFQST